MRLELFIANKLQSSRTDKASRSAVSTLNVAVVGMILAIVIMVVSVAVVTGFKQTIISKIGNLDSHIKVYNRPYEFDETPRSSISFSEELEKIISPKTDKRIRSANLIGEIPCVLKSPNGFAGLRFKGVPDNYDLSFLSSCLTAGKSDIRSHGVLISQSTADKLNIRTGERIDVYFMNEQKIKMRRCTVNGIFNTDFDDYDAYVMVGNLEVLQSVNRWPENTASYIEVKCNSMDDIDSVCSHLIDEIDKEAAEVVRLIFRLFLDGKNRNQIAVYLTQEQIPTPTFYMKDRGRGTCKNKTLNEDNRCKWNKATLTNILTRQEYCGDVVNFKTTKHFRDKHNHYVDRSQWHITENVHEPIISRSDFETVQRILENAPVRRPNGDGEIHPLSGLLFCKDCGAKMHIRIDHRNGGKRHVAYCSEYHKGKARNPKCNSPHIMDADLLMQTIAEVLKKIEDYSISNRAEFEALVKKNLAMQQTDQTKKQQKRIPQITTRLEQIDKVLNKLYEDNALGAIPQDRYELMSQKYSEEYYALKAELATLQEQLSAYENAGGRAQKFLKLTERHAAFTDLTPAILNEFISRIEVHERDQKRARYAIQHISIYFNYIGKFENEVTQLAEPTEQEIRQMREEIEEAKKEKSRAYHRQYSREYRARNLEKQREYDRMKAREYRARRKAQAAAQPAQ